MAVASKNPFLSSTDPLEKGLEAFRNHKASETTCSFGYVYEDGSSQVLIGQACHAGLGYPGKPDKLEYVVNYINSRTYSKTPEIRRAFTEWMVNFSPFRSVFVERDIEKIMNDEFVIASVDHPYSLMAGSLQAFRALSEHPCTGAIWYELVKNGVHPNLAFYISYAFKTDGTSLYPGSSSHTGCYTGTCLNRGTLVNFLMDKPTKLVKITYREQKSYTGAQNIFYGDGKRMDEEFIGYIDKHINQTKTSSNPFAAKPAGKKWPFKEGCAILADAIKKEFKKELENLNGKA